MTLLAQIFGIVALLFALVLAVPCAVLLIECLAALRSVRTGSEAVPAGAIPRLAVLIPAHDEELGIAGTVAALRMQDAFAGAGPSGAAQRLIVIADNCSDSTAARARAAGAAAIERADTTRRGKGFAIQFGLEHLDADPPDVVVLVDADCRVSAGGITRLAMQAARTGRPVQAEYLLTAPGAASPLGVVSALAILVRNRVRPRGLFNLGLPCQLTGSGMAFPWRVLRDAPETGSNLVEDLVMGLEMAKRGQLPLLCPDVAVTSELPVGQGAAMKQRRRWEHGQLQSLLRYGPRLIASGLVRGKAGLLGLGLDLIVPPLAMLVLALLATLGLFVTAAALTWLSWAPALVVAVAFAMLTAAVLFGWAKFGRATIPASTLIMVPFYVLWKVPLYLSLLVGRRQKTWERTERAGEAATLPPTAAAKTESVPAVLD